MDWSLKSTGCKVVLTHHHHFSHSSSPQHLPTRQTFTSLPLTGSHHPEFIPATVNRQDGIPSSLTIMAKGFFTNYRIAVLGKPVVNSDEAPSFKDLMDLGNIDRWITNNGGELVKKVDRKTNVVIVSRLEWSRRNEATITDDTGASVKNEGK